MISTSQSYSEDGMLQQILACNKYLTNGDDEGADELTGCEAGRREKAMLSL